MHLNTLIKLIENNTNLLGYINSKKLNKEISNYISNQIQCLTITIVREPSCKISLKTIFSTIIIPVIQAKNIQYRESKNAVYCYSSSLIYLRTIDKACALLNHQMQPYHFSIITNYDILSSDNKEVNI